MKIKRDVVLEASLLTSGLLAFNLFMCSVYLANTDSQQMTELDIRQSSLMVGGYWVPCADCDEENANDCPNCIAPPDSSCQYVGVDDRVTVSYCFKNPVKVLKGLAGSNGYSDDGSKFSCKKKILSTGCSTSGGEATCGKRVYAECNKQQPDAQHQNEWCKGECEQSVNDGKNCS